MKIFRTSQNIFTLAKTNSSAVCIATNGMCDKNGCAVMDTGIAKKARDSLKDIENPRYCIDEKLGNYLRQYGNRAFMLGRYCYLSSIKV